jgi:hypothetical protein
MNKIPATIDFPGAIATNASNSIMTPKECFLQAVHQQPSVK